MRACRGGLDLGRSEVPSTKRSPAGRYRPLRDVTNATHEPDDVVAESTDEDDDEDGDHRGGVGVVMEAAMDARRLGRQRREGDVTVVNDEVVIVHETMLADHDADATAKDDPLARFAAAPIPTEDDPGPATAAPTRRRLRHHRPNDREDSDDDDDDDARFEVDDAPVSEHSDGSQERTAGVKGFRMTELLGDGYGKGMRRRRRGGGEARLTVADLIAARRGNKQLSSTLPAATKRRMSGMGMSGRVMSGRVMSGMGMSGRVSGRMRGRMTTAGRTIATRMTPTIFPRFQSRPWTRRRTSAPTTVVSSPRSCSPRRGEGRAPGRREHRRRRRRQGTPGRVPGHERRRGGGGGGGRGGWKRRGAHATKPGARRGDELVRSVDAHRRRARRG